MTQNDSKTSRGDRNRQLLAEYKEIVRAAEVKLGTDVNRLLTDAGQLLDMAGTNYAHAVEQGKAAFNRIHEPAREHYRKQLDLAISVQNAIIDPASQELERVTTAVRDLIKKAIAPIEQVYSDALNEASGLTDGISLGGSLSG